MPTRLLLDGQDLRALMLRVRDEMGPDATIVRAERVRTGGIAGFFAREHYELTVEVPDAPPSATAHARPAPEATAARPTGQVAEPVGLEALLAAADEMERTPQVSTDTDGFAEVLASVARITADGRPAAAPPEPTPGTGGDPAAPDEGGRDAAEPASWVPAVPRSVTPTGLPAPTPMPLPPTFPTPAPAVPVAPDAVPTALEGADRRPDAAAEPSADAAAVAALLELGVPTRLLAGFDDPTGMVPLSQVVRGFDRPEVAGPVPGSLVVVAGAGDLAVRTAVAMALRAGLDAQDVVLAGELDALPGHGRRVQTTASASRVRSRVTDDAPTIVALGVGGTAAGALLLSALAPDEAWAAVDARLRGVELRRWLRSVGARRGLDAVAANHAFEAQSPGTVLNLGVPVGWLDGLPASPVVWAALLAERLADDAGWD